MDYAPQFVQDVLETYTNLLGIGLPIAFFIGACNVGINIVLSAAFGGKLRIGRGD